jgi:hypothetical protein
LLAYLLTKCRIISKKKNEEVKPTSDGKKRANFINKNPPPPQKNYKMTKERKKKRNIPAKN